MKKYNFLFVLGLFFLASCTGVDPDPCDSTAASEKIVNLKITAHVETLSGTPIADEHIYFTLTLVRCDDTEQVYDYSGETDSTGALTTEIANFVLDNTADQIVLLAIASNLENYVEQNFEQKLLKYDQLFGFGVEEYDLLIQAED